MNDEDDEGNDDDDFDDDNDDKNEEIRSKIKEEIRKSLKCRKAYRGWYYFEVSRITDEEITIWMINCWN